MHAVNLKSAWEATDADLPAPPIRVSLPLDWAALPWPEGRAPTHAQLVRRFGRPPLRGDAPADRFRLCLRGCEGVEEMRLNGAPVAWREDEGWLIVDPGELLPRNTLSIRVGLARATKDDGPWGVEARLECG